MKPKSRTKQLKKLHNQLKKVQDQLSIRTRVKSFNKQNDAYTSATVFTLKGRIEKRIQTLENFAKIS